MSRSLVYQRKCHYIKLVIDIVYLQEYFSTVFFPFAIYKRLKTFMINDGLELVIHILSLETQHCMCGYLGIFLMSHDDFNAMLKGRVKVRPLLRCVSFTVNL